MTVIRVGVTFDGASAYDLWSYIRQLELKARLDGPLPKCPPAVSTAIEELRWVAGQHVSPARGPVQGTSRDTASGWESGQEVTTDQAAELLFVGSKQARRLLRAAGIDPVNADPRRLRWRTQDVQALAEARRRNR